MFYVLINKKTGEVFFAGRSSNLPSRGAQLLKRFSQIDMVMLAFQTEMSERELITYLKTAFEIDRDNGQEVWQESFDCPPEGIVRLEWGKSYYLPKVSQSLKDKMKKLNVNQIYKKDDLVNNPGIGISNQSILIKNGYLEKAAKGYVRVLKNKE